MYRCFFFIGFVVTSFLTLAQKKEKPVEEYLPTENLEMKKDANKRANKPKRKHIGLIYVPDADKIAYGNPCVTEETHRMGFEYIVEPVNSRRSSKTWMGKRLNNLWVKSKLVVTRSPFWKVILNNKIKKCRKMTGDLTG